MSKHIEKLKKQLSEVSEVVNSFQSEAVQLKIIDRLLDAMVDFEKNDNEHLDVLHKKDHKKAGTNGDDQFYEDHRKKPGATKILNQLLSSDFFNIPRSISAIATYCKDKFDSEFRTSELSGILLKLANENKLRRERNHDNNRFEYIAV